jgi:hypothetical protein
MLVNQLGGVQAHKVDDVNTILSTYTPHGESKNDKCEVSVGWHRQYAEFY